MRTHLFNKHGIYLLLLIGVFWLIKIPQTGIRLSDSNIYFYNAYQIVQGQLLYRDIFFTNFPLVPYISSLYFYISQGNINFYYVTPILEVSAAAILIFITIAAMYKNYTAAIAGSSLYLFSFIILSTTDHQTGVFMASVFAVLSLYFFHNKKYARAGIITSFVILTKAYFLPLALSYFVYLLIKKQLKNALTFTISALLTSLIILLPFLIFARNEFISDVFSYSLTRSAGLNKGEIMWFFIFHDLAFFVLLLINILLYKKQLFFSLFSVFSILFIMVYQDIYYLYLNFMVPILAVSLGFWWNAIHKQFSIQKAVIPTILGILFFINLYMYSNGYSSLQKITNIDSMVSSINKSQPNYLYGTNDITPLLSYLSEVPMLDNITDTNTNLYRKGILNASQLTQKAIATNSLIITHGAFYPQMNFHQPIIDEIFTTEMILDKCNLMTRFPVKAEGYTNEVNYFICRSAKP